MSHTFRDLVLTQKRPFGLSKLRGIVSMGVELLRYWRVDSYVTYWEMRADHPKWFGAAKAALVAVSAVQ